jgi:membrane protein implicated in regulation of membrane protease activity
MSSLTLFWIAVGIAFLIIEMITVTFYGLSIALAAFVTGLFVWYTGVDTVTIAQAGVFALVSFFASYYLPRILTSKTEEHPQGLDIYIGETRSVRKVGEDYKVSLDGVLYIVDIEDLKSGDKVELTSRRGSVFHGKII